MRITAKPCSCMRMTQAIADGELIVAVVRDADKTAPVIGIPTVKPEPSGINPIVYCPWCGNAAFEVRETDDV